MAEKLMSASEKSPILQEIKNVLDAARGNVARQVNSELLNAYWHIARQCLAFFIGQIEQTHILKIGAGETLAECIGQFLGQYLQSLLAVVGPLRKGLLILADDSADIPIGAQQLAVDLSGHFAAGSFQNRSNLLNNRGEVVGKCQILLIHNHLLPFKVITFPLLYAIAGGCQTKD